MNVIQRLQSKVRNVINDPGTADTHTEVAGAGRVFTLPQENAYSVASVTVAGISIAGHYTYNSVDQTVTIANGYVDSGDTVVIYFSYYKYSDADLLRYIEHAIILMDANGYPVHFDISNDDTEIYPNMLPKEQSLVANICGVLIQPDYSQKRTPNVTVVYPRTMPKEKIVEMLISKFKTSKEGLGGSITLGGVSEGENYEPV